MSPGPEYFQEMAVAFVRGRALRGDPIALPAGVCSKDLAELTEAECAMILSAGAAAGLRLAKFERSLTLPRIKPVLGMLKQFWPSTLLDVGSGRGAFLWPLLDAFPALHVTSIDLSPQRVADIQAVRAGGVSRLNGYSMSIEQIAFPEGSFDVVTALEVLEHLEDAAKAVLEITRVADRAVIASVPVQEDSNPEHKHVLSEEDLRRLFVNAGITRLGFQYVPGHRIVLALKGALDEQRGCGG